MRLNTRNFGAATWGSLWSGPEVITEGKTLEECREMLKDALKEMIKAYRQLRKEIPAGGTLLEQTPVEVPLTQPSPKGERAG